jgi:hypothetical protein
MKKKNEDKKFKKWYFVKTIFTEILTHEIQNFQIFAIWLDTPYNSKFSCKKPNNFSKSIFIEILIKF